MIVSQTPQVADRACDIRARRARSLWWACFALLLSLSVRVRAESPATELDASAPIVAAPSDPNAPAPDAASDFAPAASALDAGVFVALSATDAGVPAVADASGADVVSVPVAPAEPEYPPASVPAPREPEVVFVRPPALALPPSLAARERALAASLGVLARRSKDRVLRGALQIGLGAAAVTAGALLHDEIARSLLILLGAGAVVHGTVQLTLAPAAEQPEKAFAALPRYDLAQAHARIAFGERALAELAQSGRRTRIVQGSATMFIAASYVPLLYWLSRRADVDYRFGDNPFDWVGIALATIDFASGLFSALTESEAEELYARYRTLCAELERTAPQELTPAGPSTRSRALRFGIRIVF